MLSSCSIAFTDGDGGFGIFSQDRRDIGRIKGEFSVARLLDEYDEPNGEGEEG